MNTESVSRSLASFRRPAFKHQLREFLDHRDDPARALIWQMRTGKSKACVDLACYLYEEPLTVDAVLVVAPNNVHLNWHRRELPKHMWDSTPWRSFVWSTAKSHNIQFDVHFEDFLRAKGLLWFEVNAEALANPHAKKYIARFMKGRRVLLVVDEVHEFRRPGSKRSRALRGLAPHCPVRRILSGTPLDNSPLHAYAEYEVLEHGALGYTTYADFEERYAVKEDIWVPGGFRKDGVKKPPRKQPAVVDYQNLDELQASIANWSSVVTRGECDDLPDLVLTDTLFELTSKQKQVYNDMVRGTLARLDTGELIPPEEGGVLLTRLKQVTSGYVVDEDGAVHDIVSMDENPRFLALIEELRLCPGKAVVWCMWRRDVEQVTLALNQRGIKAVHYYGGTSDRDRQRHEDWFRDKPEYRVLVGQPQAGGQGLDFSAAGDIFWYSHTSNLIHRKQADERATQVGGRKIGVTNLIAVGSCDEKTLRDLADKVDRTEFLTGEGLRSFMELIR